MERTGKNILFYVPGLDNMTEILKHPGLDKYNIIQAAILPELLRLLGRGDFHLAVFGLDSQNGNITDLSAAVRNICRIPVIYVLQGDFLPENLTRIKDCSDDFLFLPAKGEEFVLRIEMTIDCHRQVAGVRPDDMFRIGNIMFDFENQILRSVDGEVSLTRIEAKLLQLLCLYRNRVLPRELALETIWGENDYFKSRSMDVYVTRLRKLFHNESSVSITNIHNVGFRLNIYDAGNGKDT